MASPAVDARRAAARAAPPARVTCVCGHHIFDGEAIRSRCVKPLLGVALCKCKRWVKVPIAYEPGEGALDNR